MTESAFHQPSGGLLRPVLRADGIRAIYQPIVALETRETVAFEALARGPAGTELEQPDMLFALARAEGCLSDLDWACRAAAVRGALNAKLLPPAGLFINVEPDSLGTSCPSDAADLWARATSELLLVLEITEQALTHRPAELLRSVAEARSYGWGIALDDVGADSRSLALMPFLRPDVIKLDLRLVQRHPSRALAEIVNAVRAEAERTGATILVEGIESEAHAETALALGATLAQGYLFGRPGFLDLPTLDPPRVPLVNVTEQPAPVTPFTLIGAACEPRRSRKPLLIEISKQLEAEAAVYGETCIVVSAFQQARFFTGETAQRYGRLGRSVAFAGALAADLPRDPANGVRGHALAQGDPLRDEWNIAVIAPHFAACLSARDLGDGAPDSKRRFDYVLTFDRTLALAAARSMVKRLTD